MSQASNQSLQPGYSKRVFQRQRPLPPPVLLAYAKILAIPNQRIPEVLRTNEASLNQLLEATKILLWEGEAEGKGWRFTYVSEQAEEILGYPISAWYESDFLALHLHPEDKHGLFCQRPSQATGQYNLIFRMLARDGGVVWFRNLITVTSPWGEPKRLSGFMIDVSERKRADETLRDLGGRLIAAQENERSRIARELHDDFNQRLTLLSIELEQLGKQTAKEPGSRELVQKLQRQTQEISGDIHRLSYQLHPSKLDHLGLAAAVRSLCEEISQSAGLRVQFQQNRFPAALPKDIALCLFRVAQEALRNSVKHSGAQSVRILLRKTSNVVRLSVSDDGCGFDPKSKVRKNGLGLISMEERVRIIGGEMQVHSQSQCGTSIEVSVPLPSDLLLSNH